MRISDQGPADAPVVLLLHGGGVAGWMWRAQVEALVADRRVIVPDLPGHDGSPGEYLSHTEPLRELTELIDGLGPGPDLTVVGFSLGAQLALQLASDRPAAVRRVVVVSGLLQRVPLASALVALLPLLAPLGRSPRFARTQAKALFIPDDLVEDYVRTAGSISTRSVVGLSRANYAYRIPATWPAFPGRALLLAGSKEPGPLLAGMRSLHTALPSSELEIVPGAGHGLPLQHPDWFTERLRGWLSGG